MSDGWDRYIRAFLALSKEGQEAVLEREEIAARRPPDSGSTEEKNDD